MEIRNSIMLLACEMERKLRENDYKGGWVDNSFEYLINKLREELSELEVFIFTHLKDKEAAIKECADVANYVMMIADKIRRGE